MRNGFVTFRRLFTSQIFGKSDDAVALLARDFFGLEPLPLFVITLLWLSAST